MQADLLRDVIANIRKRTKRGTIHINTNGTRTHHRHYCRHGHRYADHYMASLSSSWCAVPEVVGGLKESGLDSLRVDVNSVRREYFNRFVRLNYEPVLERLRMAARERIERAKRGETEPEPEEGAEEDVSFEPDDCFDKAKESLKAMKVIYC
jgi:hypothetical protein